MIENETLGQHKRYKAYFIGTNELQKKEFKNSKCIMIISVGQKYHEKGELEAAITLINKYFGYCNILVCDTLQRHSICIEQQDKSADQIYTIAKNLGNNWIERNTPYISAFTIPYTISRWDEWIKKDRYQHYYKEVCNLYASDNSYKNTVDQIAEEFLLRRNSLNIPNRSLAFDLCIKFLLEESAVACMWVEAGYKFDVYPTRSNLAMILAYKKLVPCEINLGASSLRLNIKKFSNNSINLLKTEEYKNIATNNILTHAPGHIYWKNRAGVFLGCNVEHAQYFGFDTPIDIIGKTNGDFLDEESAAYISDIDNKVMNTGQECIIEECVNGSQYFLSKKIPLRDYNNKVIGLLGTSINITKQKDLEVNLEKTVEELAKALDSKESFIKNMNHEIRTPMQLILTGPQLLKENFYQLDEEAKLYFLDGMITATKRLNDLVSNLFDMSKFKEGKFISSFNKEECNILFEEVIQEFSLVYSNRIKYEFRLKKLMNISYVICDKIRIQQVLRNLIMNSIKYSKDGTPIHIEVSNYIIDKIHFIKCSVKDEGVGIPEKEKFLVFEPFIRSTLTNAISGGVGLGLSISKEIIQSHDGKIWIDDIEEGEVGTRVSFVIPVSSSNFVA